MLRINKRVDYAMRVVLALAKRPEGTRVTARQIQDEMAVPQAFLRRIVADLSRMGLVRTYLGPKGGLQLARRPEEISMYDVITAIEGPVVLAACLYDHDDCPMSGTCVIQSRWQQIQDTMIEQLQATTFADLMRQSRQLVSVA